MHVRLDMISLLVTVETAQVSSTLVLVRLDMISTLVTVGGDCSGRATAIIEKNSWVKKWPPAVLMQVMLSVLPDPPPPLIDVGGKNKAKG